MILLHVPQCQRAGVFAKAAAPAFVTIARCAAFVGAQSFRLGQLWRRDVKCAFHGKNLTPFLGGVKQEGRVG